MTAIWVDEYLVKGYEGGWLSTGNYYYERKKFGRAPPGKYAAWNKMVAALSDLDRHPRDTQHATARLIMGVRKIKWTYDIDPETGVNEVVVGMCLLASHLSGRAGKGLLSAKVDNRGCGVHLMFPEKDFASEVPSFSQLLCEGVVHEVRTLHAKLLESPQTIEAPDDVPLGVYR